MTTGQLPLDGNEANRAPPTPTEQRHMLINGTDALHRSFPPAPGDSRTAEQLVDDALAKGVVRLQTQEALLDQHDADEADAVAALRSGRAVMVRPGDDATAEFERFLRDQDADSPVYSIPHQAAIECRPLADGGIEIWQEGQHGPDDGGTIQVVAGNAVMLARRLLAAAGFRTVGIYTRVKGGNVDLDDGDIAASVYSEHPARQ